MELQAEECLRRFVLQGVPPHCVRSRHFGRLATRARRDQCTRCRQLLAVAAAPAVAALPRKNRETPAAGVEQGASSRGPACRVGRWRRSEILAPPQGHPPCSPQASSGRFSFPLHRWCSSSLAARPRLTSVRPRAFPTRECRTGHRRPGRGCLPRLERWALGESSPPRPTEWPRLSDGLNPHSALPVVGQRFCSTRIYPPCGAGSLRARRALHSAARRIKSFTFGDVAPMMRSEAGCDS